MKMTYKVSKLDFQIEKKNCFNNSKLIRYSNSDITLAKKFVRKEKIDSIHILSFLLTTSYKNWKCDFQ